MTCAITPAPTTPTLSRSDIGYCLLLFVLYSRATRSVGFGKRGLDQHCAFLDTGLRVDERVFVFDGERPDRGTVEAGDELVPPRGVLAVAGNREVPRHLLRRRRPPVVEQAVEAECVVVKGDVLGVDVADARHDPLD